MGLPSASVFGWESSRQPTDTWHGQGPAGPAALDPVCGITGRLSQRYESLRGNFGHELRAPAPAASFLHISDLQAVSCLGCGGRGAAL